MFKINISDKSGKTYKLEVEGNALIDKELHDKIDGKDVSSELEGYELEITGASDKSGFTAMKEVDGIGVKKVLLGYGKGMHKKPKGDKKKNSATGGLRLRKTVRGRIISEDINQINMKVLKVGSKKLEEIFAGEKTEEKSE
ncbi:MAG: 30S ribosomal protein S6e [Candidatus Pacearchaeota archaeon]|nr:30S ribosomal protein S6e [Candidatus Pacearchaeota archaeon]